MKGKVTNMKKSTKILSLILVLILAVSVFAGCSGNNNSSSENSSSKVGSSSEISSDTSSDSRVSGDSSDDSSTNTVDEEHTIVVGASITPHAEILEVAKEQLAKEGYKLEIMEFTDYVLPNTALNDGEIDANYFQHAPYLENFNEENGTNLVIAAEMHYEPFGIYPGKAASIDELEDGAEISIPNDGTNETRALLLLQDQGLITLKEGVDASTKATVLDIAENPHNYKISEIAAEQLARSLQDVDLSVINGNYALQNGLNPNEDAIAVENSDYGTVYVNVVAVRSGTEGTEKIQALVKALQSDEVKAFIEENYTGAVIPVF